MENSCVQLSSVVCPAVLYFSTSHKRHDFREEERNCTLNVFQFPLQLVSEKFLILRTERVTIEMYIGIYVKSLLFLSEFNPLTSNHPYCGRTAPLTTIRCILYIYSTYIGTEYFKHGIYYPFFPLQNAVCFIILTCLVPVLFTFYIFIQQI